MAAKKQTFNFNRPTVTYDEKTKLWSFDLWPHKTTLASDSYQRFTGRQNRIYDGDKIPEGKTFTDLGADLFQQFYFPDLEPLEQMPEERAFTAKIMDWFREEATYAGFQGETYENQEAAALAAGLAWKMLTSDTVLKQIFELQQKIEDLRQQLQDAGLNPDGDAHEGEGEAAGALRQALAEARKKADKVGEALKNPKNEAALKNKIAEAAKQAVEQGRDTRDASEMLGWGDETGDGSPVETAGVMEFMRKHGAWLRRIIETIGRARRLTTQAAKRAAENHNPILTGGYTRDLEAIAPEALAQMGSENDGLRVMATMEFFDRGLYGALKKADYREDGHFTMAVDVSGSIGDEEFTIITGCAVAFALSAKERNREYTLYKFDTQITAKTSSRKGWKDHMRWIESRSGGGTNFDAPLRQMATDVEEAFAAGKEALDAVILSDGEARLSEDTRRRWLALKAQGVRLYYIAIGDGTGVLNELATKSLELHKVNLENADAISELVGTWLAASEKKN